MEDDDEQMQLAFRMSLQSPPRDAAMASSSQHHPVAKRWKAEDQSAGSGSSSDASERSDPPARAETAAERERRIQREVRAAAAERRLAALSASSASKQAAHTEAAAKPTGSTARGRGGEASVSGGPHVATQQETKPRGEDEKHLIPTTLEDRLKGATGAPDTSSASAPTPQPSAHSQGVLLAGEQQGLRVTPGEAPSASTATGAAAATAVDSDNNEGLWEEQHGLQALPMDEAFRLHGVVFGKDPPQQTINQWSHQGFRYHSTMKV